MRIALLSTTAFVAAVLAMPAYAQTAAPAADEASDADVIIVRARLRDENIVDVPLPVSVASEAQLKRDQIFSLNDLQRITPALEISQTSGGETNGGGRLRGLGTGVFNPSVSSSVAFVIDQVPTGNLAFPQLFDLAQVEVLRGPQGTLFGQGASAGVINVSTKAPSTSKVAVSGGVNFADKGSAGAEVGELLVNGAFNLPLGESAAIRVATQYKRETGLQRSATTGKDNVVSDFGIRVRALLKPSETVTVNISAEYAKENNAGQTFFAIAVTPNGTNIIDPDGPGPAPAGAVGTYSSNAFFNATGCNMPVINARAEFYCEAIPSRLSLSVGGISVVTDVELSDSLTMTSVTGYRERTFNQFSRDFSRILPNQAARQERTQENSRGFTQELRLTYGTDALDLVFGGIYSDFRFDRVPIGAGPFTFGVNAQGSRIGFSVCPASGVGFCPVNNNFTKETTENHTLAAFADATYKVTDQVSLFGGLRFSDYKNSTGVGVNTLVPVSTFLAKENNLSGRAGISFKPNSGTNIYASYSRGYKPTAVGTNAAGALFQLKPEKASNFELGAKFAVGGLQLSANAFYNELSNFQSQTSVFVGTALISQPLNIPKVTSKGFEFGAMGRVAPGLNINAGYQFNDIKFPTGYLGDDGGLLGGTQFLNAPKHKFTLSADYGMAVGNSLELFVNPNIVYKSAVLLAARADPRYRYPSHVLINLSMGLRDPDGKWTASLFARNLTKQREPTAYLASTFAGQADGGIRAWPVAGLTARVVGVSLGFNF